MRLGGARCRFERWEAGLRICGRMRQPFFQTPNPPPTFLSRFALVVATQMPEGDAVALDRACRRLRVPLLAVRSYGLMGYLRVSHLFLPIVTLGG